MNAFKNLACVSFASDYSFPLAERLRGSATAASSAPATSAAAAKTEAAPVKEEKKEEPEEDMDMGDLFGGGDY